MKKTRSELATLIMTALVNEGLHDTFIKGDIVSATQAFQDTVEALTMVQGRLVAAYLLKMLRSGETEEQVAMTADNIVNLVGNHFDQTVTFELANLIDSLNDIINSKQQTSH